MQLGPFYFTKLLLPALFKASTPGSKSRVVNTSSSAGIPAVSFFGSGLDFATFKDSPHRRKYGVGQLYGQSKLVRPTIATIGLIFEITLFDPQGECCIHPGIGPAAWR